MAEMHERDHAEGCTCVGCQIVDAAAIGTRLGASSMKRDVLALIKAELNDLKHQYLDPRHDDDGKTLLLEKLEQAIRRLE